MLSPSLGAPAASRYQPIMEMEATQLLYDLLTVLDKSVDDSAISTKDIYSLLERTQSSAILVLHYGLYISNFAEPILHEIMKVHAKVTYLAANPQLPDSVPILRYLPTFISPWKRYADSLYASQSKLYMRLLRHGKDAIGWNATKQAFTIAHNYADTNPPVPDLDLAFSLATSVQGGMETSPRQILWLFIAAIRYPAFLVRAQQVLDEVVGRNRLPTFSDRNNLAYINAVAHELFRWRPVAPGSIPRRADRADEFGGVKVAKGVTIVANTWAISRDEKIFEPSLGDVQDFVTERWLSQGKIRNDLPLPVFGQGRRMCQGKRVATDGTFLNIAHLLWAFDIEALHGEEVDPWAMVVVGFMTEPEPVQIRLRPRGPWVHATVSREWGAVKKTLEVLLGGVKNVE